MKIGTPSANLFLKKHGATIKTAGVLVTAYQIAGYLEVSDDKYFLCHSTTPDCISKARIRARGKEFAVFSMDFRETPDTKAFLQESVVNGSAVELDREGAYTMYVFNNE